MESKSELKRPNERILTSQPQESILGQAKLLSGSMMGTETAIMGLHLAITIALQDLVLRDILPIKGKVSEQSTELKIKITITISVWIAR